MLLHAVINTKARRFEDLLTPGDSLDVMKELVALYNRHTDAEHIDIFPTIDEGREKVLALLTRKFFPESSTSNDTLGPVARARLVFEEYQGFPRKEIIEACSKLGIKRSTAATQYQRWRKEHKMVRARRTHQ